MSTNTTATAAAARELNRHADGQFGEQQRLEQVSFTPPTPARETTLQRFNNPAMRGNYCKLPTVDVDIVDKVHHCARCHVPIIYEKTSRPVEGGRHVFSQHWVHADDPKACDSSYVTPRAWCQYCNNDAPGTVQYRAEAWADITACTRCGGETGYALGD